MQALKWFEGKAINTFYEEIARARGPRLWLPILGAALLACPGEPAEPEQAPVEPQAAPVADPLSRLVSERMQQVASRKRAEGEEVIADAQTPRPASSGFAVPSCSVVATADLDGDGAQELVCWSDGRLTFWSQGDEGLHQVYHDPQNEGVQPGEPQKIVAEDLDGDGAQELLIGWGNRRAQKGALVSVTISGVRGDSGGHRRHHEVIYHAEAPRAEIVGLGLGPGVSEGRQQLVVAHYDSQYFVTARVLSFKGGKWQGDVALRRRMASSWAFGDVTGDGRQDWVIGRPYGEGKLDPGDLILWQPGSTVETAIPTVLGLRSAIIADAVGGREKEILFGDGWHYDYGKKARARLSLASRDGAGGAWQTRLVGELSGQIEVAQIAVVDVNGDGIKEIVSAGDKSIHLWRQVENSKPLTWNGAKVLEGSDFAVGTLRHGEVWVVAAGTPIRLVRLQ